MTAISAAMVKELRDKTGAGIMDCKAALTESDGNIDAAIDFKKKRNRHCQKTGRSGCKRGNDTVLYTYGRKNRCHG